METLIIKRLIDGFYNIYDLAVSGGTTSFQSTPVYKGLKCKYWKMLPVAFYRMYSKYLYENVKFQQSWNRNNK